MIINDIGFNYQAVLDEGLTIAIVGYVTVFTALVVLYFTFTYIAKINKMQIRSRLKKQGKDIDECCADIYIPGDVVAAISMSIYLYHELHDEESNIITIKRISKTYKPWSSRALGLPGYPHK